MLNWDYFWVLPGEYYVALTILLVLVMEGLSKFTREYWAFPMLGIYGTVFLWYFVEVPANYPRYEQFRAETFFLGYLQIVLFLITFRALVPWASRRISEKGPSHAPNFLDADQTFRVVAIVWLILLLYGSWMSGRGIVNALFPLDARKTWRFMWSRGALGGTRDFMISIGFYTYLMMCAFMGVLVHVKKSPRMQTLNWAVMLLSWPYFLLSGTRSNFLGVFTPFAIGYLLLNPSPMLRKLWVTLGLLVALNSVFIVVVMYRNYGFGQVLGLEAEQELLYVGPEKENKGHEGLNMFEELCWINELQASGAYPIKWGEQYFEEAVNFIPRAFWPGKPLIGIDYAVARGFGTNNPRNKSGVTATLSLGIVGQGVVNFGMFLGALAAALLSALYVGLLARFNSQRHSLLRFCFFVAGLGLIPNLGRGISLLVLWPMVFGYILIRILERQQKALSPAQILEKERRKQQEADAWKAFGAAAAKGV